MNKFILIFVIAITSQARAIDVQFNKFTSNLRYESLESAILTNPHSGNLDKWGFRAGYSYVENPLSKGKKDQSLSSILDNLHSLQFGFNVFLTDKLELIMSTAAHRSSNNVLKEDDFSIGDISLAVKYQLYNKSNFAVALIPHLILPTGDEDLFLGGNSIGFGGLISLERQFLNYAAVFNIGYTGTEDNIFRNIDYSNLYHLGVGLRIPLKRFAVQAEYRINFTDDSSEQRPSELHLGGSYQLNENWRAFASIGLADLEFNNNNDYRLLAGIKSSFGRKEKLVVNKQEVIKEAIKEIREKLNISDSINFRIGSSELDKSSFITLDNAARLIIENQKYIESIVIEGHTDSVGRKDKNLKLSSERAHSVRTYFVKKGVSRDLVTWNGFGESKPIIKPEITKNDRSTNRRVEFRVIEKTNK